MTFDCEREKRTRTTQVRWKPEEYAIARGNAEKAGLTFSEYVRLCAMRRRITPKVDLKAIANLNRIGGLVKHLSGKGAFSGEEKARTLHELQKAIIVLGSRGSA